MLLSPERKVSFTPYPSIGSALSGVNDEAEDMKITTILTRIIGNVMSAILDIVLKPKVFSIIVIVTNIKMTISISIFGKYISTKLSAKVLITNPDIVRKYIHIAIPKIFFRSFPPCKFTYVYQVLFWKVSEYFRRYIKNNSRYGKYIY